MKKPLLTSLLQNARFSYLLVGLLTLASSARSQVNVGNITNSNLQAPLLVSPNSVYVLGNYAYVASAASNALEILDITNPATPLHKGSISDGGGAAPFLYGPSSVYVSGNYAYVASVNSNALEIVDITNPAAPVHKGSVSNGAGGGHF